RRQRGALQPDHLVEVVQLVVGRPRDQLLALGLALALLGPQLVVHLGEPGESVVHPAPLLGLRADRLHLGGEADRVHVLGGRAAVAGPAAPGVATTVAAEPGACAAGTGAARARVGTAGRRAPAVAPAACGTARAADRVRTGGRGPGARDACAAGPGVRAGAG